MATSFYSENRTDGPDGAVLMVTAGSLDLKNALCPATELAPANFSYVNAELVDFLHTQLRAQTPECIMATLGISANTWTKLKSGKPVRTSLAKRLLERLASDRRLVRARS